MNTVDIIIIIAVAALVFIMVKMSRRNKQSQSNSKSNAEDYLKGLDSDTLDGYSYASDSSSSLSSSGSGYAEYNTSTGAENGRELYQFNDAKNNNDYKEVTAVAQTMTKGKELFNVAEKPVKTTRPSRKKIFSLVKHFVDELSDKAMNNDGISDISDGWMTGLPLNKERDGWEKQMKKLGLPTSIYTKAAKPSPLKLVKINNHTSQETDDDMRIVCEILCQKESSKDRIIFEVYFWIDKRNVNDERELFKDKETSALDALSFESEDEELPIIIEKVHVLGFMIRDNSGSEDCTARKTFYDFRDIRGSDGMMDQQELMAQVISKRQARARETNTRIDAAEYDQIEKQAEILRRDTMIDALDLIFDE